MCAPNVTDPPPEFTPYVILGTIGFIAAVNLKAWFTGDWSEVSITVFSLFVTGLLAAFMIKMLFWIDQRFLDKTKALDNHFDRY